ncbi:GNAT family N-acetyltransferase [Kocuria coralli]|uniref:L-lysine N6-monooxygenase MbtG n=1 Tax=Kocuria coralli TaxID=1461025 RepID=A0A5J5KWN1_9MICC|nr:GNAT family N-acetyltransferase [Kocuria coralli]KAA9394044.1 GNAT family N-acetyltransferase [Kocuria coralli]
MNPQYPASPDVSSAEHPLDLLCVGIGPFGLGLACLADPVPGLRAAFLDRAPEFAWHPGLLFDDATLQVPFLADLVTMADPTSRFSYLAWLKRTGRLYPFYVRESFYPLRREYNDYCRWAAGEARGLHWGQDVVAVSRPGGDGPWRIVSRCDDGERIWWAHHLVIGTGTSPTLPAALAGAGEAAVHAGQYLLHRDELLSREHVTVLGSGQSAAEVIVDLLEAPNGPAVDWITRSPRFYPMEYSKLSLELTSPDYLDHFRSLPEDDRELLNASQPQLHRGISEETIDRLYEALYVRRHAGGRPPVRMIAATSLETTTAHRGRTLLSWRNTENGAVRETVTDAVVAGSGYEPSPLPWLDEVRDQLSLDAQGRLAPDRLHRASPDGSVHVLNWGEHTHALTAPDLGMGPLRNAHVLAHVTGRSVYPTESHTTFQSFGRLPQTSGFLALTAPAGTTRATTVAGRSLTLRPIDLDRDLDVLHDWLADPRAEAWGLVGAERQAVLAEYQRMEAEPSERAWLVEEAGRPLAMVEVYDPACSPLAAAYPVRDGDAGLHLFLAPADRPVTGTSRVVMAAALDLVLADRAVQRVVVEPDTANAAIRRINRWAGFRELGDIELPDKTACLSIADRAEAVQAGSVAPSDLERREREPEQHLNRSETQEVSA